MKNENKTKLGMNNLQAKCNACIHCEINFFFASSYMYAKFNLYLQRACFAKIRIYHIYMNEEKRLSRTDKDQKHACRLVLISLIVNCLYARKYSLSQRQE